MKLKLLFTTLFWVVTGCTGLSLGENEPGADTWLETGSLAVDPVTETTYTLQTSGMRFESTGTDPEAGEVKNIVSVTPEGEVRKVADVSDMSDVRILFPRDGVLIMGETGGHDELRMLDRTTLDEVYRLPTSARYNGTRMSPSRRFVAVADNSGAPGESSPIHVIDTVDQRIEIMPHGGSWLEAMFLNQSDTLVAIVFYDSDTASPYARLLTWSADALVSQGFQTGDDGLWAGAELDIRVDGVVADILFSFTWVGISPDDKTAVFPVRGVNADTGEQHYELLVLDLPSAMVRRVQDAQGPVGFTPDSSTIVSYGYGQNEAGTTVPELRLIDRVSLAVSTMPIPFEGGPSFFVSHEGNFVVVTAHIGNQGLVLYDLDREEMTELGGNVALTEFVSRIGHQELWLIGEGLHRLDFMTAELEVIDLSFRPEHVNILRTRDLLVLDDEAGDTVHFFDPSTRTVTMSVDLPAVGPQDG